MAKDSYKRGTARGHRPERRISVRGVRRAEPDLKRLAQALIALAQAQAEADAQHQASGSRVGGVEGTQVPKEAA